MFSGIYELFLGRKGFNVGKQPENFPGAEKTVPQNYLFFFNLNFTHSLDVY